MAPGAKELRRQQLAQQLWQSQESDLVRRVTLLENLIRRTADLPAFDVSADDRKKRERKIQDQLAAERVHNLQFQQLYDGPFYRPDQATSETGFFTNPGEERYMVEHQMVEHLKNETWKDHNQLTMFMAGDHDRLLDSLALLDEEEEEFWPYGGYEAYGPYGPGGPGGPGYGAYDPRVDSRRGKAFFYGAEGARYRSYLYGREGYGSMLTRRLPWYAPC